MLNLRGAVDWHELMESDILGRRMLWNFITSSSFDRTKIIEASSSWDGWTIANLAILCDLFGMVKWPFSMVKWPLNRCDEKVTLNHLEHVFFVSFHPWKTHENHWVGELAPLGPGCFSLADCGIEHPKAGPRDDVAWLKKNASPEIPRVDRLWFYRVPCLVGGWDHHFITIKC